MSHRNAIGRIHWGSRWREVSWLGRGMARGWGHPHSCGMRHHLSSALWLWLRLRGIVTVGKVTRELWILV